jgi:hypothetical protein
MLKYMLVNSDIEVTANWLLPVIETFKPETAIIQPKILDFKIKHALNTQELRVVSSINMGILTAEAPFKTIEKTWDNTTTK